MGIYLVDTNVLGEMSRETPNRMVLAAYERHFGQVATSATVVHEIEYGIQRLPSSRKRALLERFRDEVVASWRILPYGAKAARWHARERARLVRAGYTPPFQDGQIAAVAAVNDAVLVTANLADFARFEGLRVTSWA